MNRTGRNDYSAEKAPEPNAKSKHIHTQTHIGPITEMLNPRLFTPRWAKGGRIKAYKTHQPLIRSILPIYESQPVLAATDPIPCSGEVH